MVVLPVAAQEPDVSLLYRLTPTIVSPNAMDRIAILEDRLLEEPANYELSWSLASEYTTVAADDTVAESTRQLAYRGLEHAREATQLDSDGIDGHYWQAASAGLLAGLEGGRTKVRLADEAWHASGWVLSADSSHAGAHYVRGRIHGAVMRLNRFTRFLARMLLGGDAVGQASWELAEYHLQQAAELQPELPMHHFELAILYRDIGRPELIPAALQRTLAAPGSGALDERYRAQAKTWLEEGRGDRASAP